MMTIDQIDAAFEFWLTISFGVLIATHVTRESIAIQLKVAMFFLYIAASLVAFLHTIGDLASVRVLMEFVPDLLESGEIFNQVAGLIRIALYIFGTIGVSVLIFKYEKWTTGRDT